MNYTNVASVGLVLSSDLYGLVYWTAVPDFGQGDAQWIAGLSVLLLTPAVALAGEAIWYYRY